MTPPSPAKKGRGKKENNVLISFYEFKKNCHITPEGSISPREKCLVCQMVSPALPAIHLQLFSISTRETWQPYSHTRKKKKRKKSVVCSLDQESLHRKLPGPNGASARCRGGQQQLVEISLIPTLCIPATPCGKVVCLFLILHILFAWYLLTFRLSYVLPQSPELPAHACFERMQRCKSEAEYSNHMTQFGSHKNKCSIFGLKKKSF